MHKHTMSEAEALRIVAARLAMHTMTARDAAVRIPNLAANSANIEDVNESVVDALGVGDAYRSALSRLARTAA